MENRWDEMTAAQRRAFAEWQPSTQYHRQRVVIGVSHRRYVRCLHDLHEWEALNLLDDKDEQLKRTLTIERRCRK